jgi:hypothetical protein
MPSEMPSEMQQRATARECNGSGHAAGPMGVGVFVVVPTAETPAPHWSVAACQGCATHLTSGPLHPAVVPETARHQYRNRRALASCTTHSSPSCRFMPVMALHVMMCHLCVLIASRRRPCCRYYWPDNHSMVQVSVTYLAHFVLGHGAGNIALVLEDEQACSRETLDRSAQDRMHHPNTNLFLQQPCQLVATVVDALAVSRVHHPDERVRLLKVVLPVRPQRLLAADIPCAVSIWSWEASRCSTYVQFVASTFTACYHVAYPSYSIVLMMKPRVGLTLLTSSFMILFTMVVFPALSKPLLQSAFETVNMSRTPTA